MQVEVAGQNQEMQRSFASLGFALALAAFLVYLVMAGTFESLIHPFLIMFTLPLGMVGVVAGLRGLGGGGTFEGVALYAEWTTDDAEWSAYERYWRGR